MKKILSLIIAILIAFSLVACNDEEPGTHTKPVVPTEAETPAETPEETPEDTEPDVSESEQTPEETPEETEPESETKGKGTIELPRDEF
jgi:hypothetical protein